MKHLRKFEAYEGPLAIPFEEDKYREKEMTDPYFEFEEEKEGPFMSAGEEDPSEEESGNVIPPFEDPNEDLPEPYRTIHGHGQPHPQSGRNLLKRFGE